MHHSVPVPGCENHLQTVTRTNAEHCTTFETGHCHFVEQKLCHNAVECAEFEFLMFCT